MKSKSLASQDYSYGIVFMDKNMMAEILVLDPQFFALVLFICAPQSLGT